MAHTPTPPARKGPRRARVLVTSVAKRHGIPEVEAARLVLRYLRRARERSFCPGWWLRLLDAQFQTHLGSCPRIRCGQEVHLRHLIPDGGLCHDCGCARGEYHVFGCDAEECSRCGGQAFCCDCANGSCPCSLGHRSPVTL